MDVASNQLKTARKILLGLAIVASLVVALQPAVSSGQTQSSRDWFPGISGERWNEIAGSRMIGSNAGSILRMLSRMENITQQNWHAVSDPPGSIDLSQLVRAPEGYAGMAVQLEGTVLKYQRVPLDDGLSSSFEVEQLYAAECKTSPTEDGAEGQTVLLISDTIPQLWKPFAKDLSEPVRSFGIFLTTNNDGVPVFVSPEIEWYPSRKSAGENALQGLTDGHHLLASAGLNVAQLDGLKHGSFVAFTPNEVACFRSMLVATKNLTEQPDSLVDVRPSKFQLVETLRKPDRFKASYVSLEGRVRRISRVQIGAPELSKLLGQDYYYHVDFYLPIKNTSLNVSDSEGNRIWLGPSFGTTLLLLQLPEGMNESNMGNESRWQIDAFFLKTWAHKTVDSREKSRTLRRPNPIFFGLTKTAQQVKFDTQADGSLTWAISLFWLGLIGFCGGLVFWLRNR